MGAALLAVEGEGEQVERTAAQSELGPVDHTDDL
jgi:hypothetical protein